MKNPLDAVKLFLGAVCVVGAFAAAAFAPGSADERPAAPLPGPSPSPVSEASGALDGGTYPPEAQP